MILPYRIAENRWNLYAMGKRVVRNARTKTVFLKIFPRLRLAHALSMDIVADLG
jgi:hypothetical protein